MIDGEGYKPPQPMTEQKPAKPDHNKGKIIGGALAGLAGAAAVVGVVTHKETPPPQPPTPSTPQSTPEAHTVTPTKPLELRPTPSIEVPIVVTPTETPITLTTQPGEQAAAATQTAEAAQVPENPFIINGLNFFGNVVDQEHQVITPITTTMTLEVPDGKDARFDLTIYPKLLQEEDQGEDPAGIPGVNVNPVSQDPLYESLIIPDHTGHLAGKPLDFEGIREYAQNPDGVAGFTLNTITRAEGKARMEKLVGTVVPIKQADGSMGRGLVTGTYFMYPQQTLNYLQATRDYIDDPNNMDLRNKVSITHFLDTQPTLDPTVISLIGCTTNYKDDPRSLIDPKSHKQVDYNNVINPVTKKRLPDIQRGRVVITVQILPKQ